ncbi:MAG: hypothetical protein QM813_22670 [Verrucomicrobiota bacterium]
MRDTFLTLALVSVLSVAASSKSAEPLTASRVTWKEHFGSSTLDTNTLFTLMAHGYFRAESTNVQSVVDTWLKNHPQAIVLPVSTGGPVMARLPSSRLSYVWVVQGSDSLNVELVRRGCLAPETQKLNPDEKPEVSQKDYDAFVQRVSKAAESAKAEKIGIWRETR